MGQSYKIAQVRKAKGLTQKALAEQIGTTQQAVARWESGDRDLKGSTLMKMSNAMGVSVSYLLGLNDDDTVELTPFATHVIPVLREIPAEDPLDWGEGATEHHPLSDDLFEAHPHSFWYAVQGNSMNKLFADGTLVLVDPKAEIKSSDVALVREGENVVPKRVFLESGFVRLHPESYDPEYGDKVVREDDPDAPKLSFVGRIVSFTAPKDWRP